VSAAARDERDAAQQVLVMKSARLGTPRSWRRQRPGATEHCCPPRN